MPAAENPTVLALLTPLTLLRDTKALVTPPRGVGSIHGLRANADTDAIGAFVGFQSADAVLGDLDAVLIEDDDTHPTNAVGRRCRQVVLGDHGASVGVGSAGARRVDTIDVRV